MHLNKSRNVRFFKGWGGCLHNALFTVAARIGDSTGESAGPTITILVSHRFSTVGMADLAKPEYDQSFLIAPPAEDGGVSEDEPSSEDQDPQYEEAIRLVLQMGKASTSTLQSHLRLGYGRAARILDMMQRDGIIGPPDGSKPREVLKRPDWLREVEVR